MGNIAGEIPGEHGTGDIFGWDPSSDGVWGQNYVIILHFNYTEANNVPLWLTLICFY